MRRAAKTARRAGWKLNNKRVCRLWREEGLWAMDFQFDTTADDPQIKLLNVIDEFTRECLAIEVDRSIDADHLTNVVIAWNTIDIGRYGLHALKTPRNGQFRPLRNI
jgi:putative transposase